MWKKISIYTTPEALEAVAGRLYMLGIEQVEINEDLQGIESYLREASLYWDYAEPRELVGDRPEPFVTAYIADIDENRELIASIAPDIEALKKEELGIDLGSLRMEYDEVDEEDWANNWKAYYKPIEIGERLLVCPSWEKAEDAGRVTLSLDPGMAFGSGSHQTTGMCLEFIEGLDVSGMSVADLGCGSGILSIAALLLGAKSAVAVDIDPIVEDVVRENAELNGIGGEYTVFTGNVLADGEAKKRVAAEKYDLVLANIVASVIIPLVPFARQIVGENGLFVTSGIISDREQEVCETLGKNGFEVQSVKHRDDWVAIMARVK